MCPLQAFYIFAVQVTFICMFYFFAKVLGFDEHMETDSAFNLWYWKCGPTSTGYAEFSRDLYCGNRM